MYILYSVEVWRSNNPSPNPACAASKYFGWLMNFQSESSAAEKWWQRDQKTIAGDDAVDTCAERYWPGILTRPGQENTWKMAR